MTYFVVTRNNDAIMHFGIKGQKWGVRRYENEDGTLTDEGKIRYAKAEKNANQYVSAKDRLKKIGKSAGIGAAAGGSFSSGVIARQVGDEYYSRQQSVFNAIANTLSGHNFVNTEAIVAFTLAGGLAGATISGIKQGYQAIKVKRGQQFIEKYKDAYNKTYG